MLLGWFGSLSLLVGVLMAVATAVSDVVVVESCGVHDGLEWLTVRLRGDGYCDWLDHYQALPRVVQYNGKLGAFVLRSWNSDRGTAHYSTARPWEVARAAS